MRAWTRSSSVSDDDDTGVGARRRPRRSRVGSTRTRLHNTPVQPPCSSVEVPLLFETQRVHSGSSADPSTSGDESCDQVRAGSDDASDGHDDAREEGCGGTGGAASRASVYERGLGRGAEWQLKMRHKGNMLQARMERIEAEKHTRDRAAALQKVEDAFVFCQNLAGGVAEDASNISMEPEAQTTENADPERRGDDAVHISASPGAWKGRFQNPLTKAWLEMELPVVARDDRDLWSAQGCDIGAFTLTASAKHGEVTLVKSYYGKQGNERQGVTYQGTLLNGKLVGTFMLAKDKGATSGLFELEVGEESVLTQICKEHDADEYDSFPRKFAYKASFCSHHTIGHVLGGNHEAEGIARNVQLEIQEHAQARERREKLETQVLTQSNVVDEHTDVEDGDPEEDVECNDDKHEREHEHEDEKDKQDRDTRIGASASQNASSPPSLETPLDVLQAHLGNAVAAQGNPAGKFSSLLLQGEEGANRLEGEREEDDNRDNQGMPRTGPARKGESSDTGYARHYTADRGREDSVVMSCDYAQALRVQISPNEGSALLCTAAELVHSGHETEDTVRRTPLSSDTHHTLCGLEDTRFHAYNSAGLSSRLSSVLNSSSPISSARPSRYSQASPPRVASPSGGSEQGSESYIGSCREARFQYSKSPPPSRTSMASHNTCVTISDTSQPSASKELMSQWAFERAVEFLKAQTSMPRSDGNNSLSDESKKNGCKTDPPYLREWKVQRGIDFFSQPELQHGADWNCRILDDFAAIAVTPPRSVCLGEDSSPTTGEQVSSKRISTQELLVRMQAHCQKAEASTYGDTKDRVTHIVMEGTGVGGVSGAIEQRNKALAQEKKSLPCEQNDASCLLGASVGQKNRQHRASVTPRNDEGKDVQEQMKGREHGKKQSVQQNKVGPTNGKRGQEKLRTWESTGSVEDDCKDKNSQGNEHAKPEEDQSRKCGGTRTVEETRQNFTGIHESEKAKEDESAEEGTDESEEEGHGNVAIEAEEKENLRTGSAEVTQRKHEVKEASKNGDAKETGQGTNDGSEEETDEDDEETIELADVRGILYHQEIEFQRDLYRERLKRMHCKVQRLREQCASYRRELQQRDKQVEEQTEHQSGAECRAAGSTSETSTEMEMADEEGNCEALKQARDTPYSRLKQQTLEVKEKLEQKQHGEIASRPARGSSLAASLSAEAWFVLWLCLLAGGLFAAVCWVRDGCIDGGLALFVRKTFRRGAEHFVDRLFSAGKEESKELM